MAVKVWVCREAGRAMLRLRWIDPETGKPRVRSARTADARAAERAAARLEEELAAGSAADGGIGWAAFVARYDAEHLAGLRPKSRRRALEVLRDFAAGSRPPVARLADVTELAVNRHLAACRSAGLTPATQRNHLVYLKGALNWALAVKLVRAAPNFPAVKVPKKKPQPVGSADFQKLLAAAPDGRWRAFLLVGWWSGLRLMEARRLRRSAQADQPWVDFAGDRLVLPAAAVKADADQWVPLHPTLRAALLQIDGDELFGFTTPAGKPLTDASLSNRVLRIARAAGVGLSYHRLRKGFGCRVAAQLGRGNAPVLHRLMRHTSMQITLDYYASTDDVLHASLAALAG